MFVLWSFLLAWFHEIGCWIIDVCGLMVRMPCLFSKTGTKNFSRLLKMMNVATVARTLIANPEFLFHSRLAVVVFAFAWKSLFYCPWQITAWHITKWNAVFHLVIPIISKMPLSRLIVPLNHVISQYLFHFDHQLTKIIEHSICIQNSWDFLQNALYDL